ncbi:BMP family ABC transporter substrate-binding protein [Tessaracoccus aquimaris]|uniref:BMP family ABC transporter substrate-binding protein n=1 Tax=Tessaracoccus aquimaris TaxID=1332264 RepID=A0A1Q2CNN8_9ACTN|nr:BMP family ABC transporter substrate-binding protein [Tessaracoccus aquimaris]AQP47726.1 BMP family ABC transporter substrate-binding protein [Tessaracoccus aquimaris]
MKKSLLSALAIAGASALALAGCAAPPSEGSPAPTDKASTPADTSSPAATDGGGDAANFLACMVSDAGGFDDKSFNETAYKGLMDAKDKLGIQTKEIESNAESEYAGNVQSMIDAKCNIIVTVGFALASATEAAAKQHPDVNFAIVDNSSFEGVTNAKGLIFNTAQPAFLAGYTAAAMSKTGTVGTFGGANYPTVSIFMDGFAEGVAYHNEAKGTSVKVLGWDEAKQDGQFIGGQNPFGDIPGGKNTANTLIAQGADIIMPVAGPAGIGALQAAQESGGKVNAIWVDTDGFVSAPEYGPQIVTSVEKAMDVAVFEAITAAKDGKFSSDAYVGTLENDGVSLADFHDFADKLPEGLQAELDQVKADIISGKITIKSPSQPK